MIYSIEDKALLERTIKRKSSETVIFRSADIPESVRMPLLNQLSLDIFRCRMMIDLADGDLSSLPNNIEILTNGLEASDPKLYMKYMDMLDIQSCKEEEKYLLLYNVLLSHVPDFSAAMGNVMYLLSRKDLFTDSEINNLVKVRNMMDRLSYVYSMLSNAEGINFNKANEYTSFCSEECSMMLKIHTGKHVSFEEISTHMDWSKTVDRESFKEICLSCMVDSEKELWESFDNGWDRRMQVYLGRAICDQVFGAPTTEEKISCASGIRIHG